MAEDATTHKPPRRIDLYLSGGGYRAALGALGVMYFLALEGRWQEVGRIISVSGGSIVNAHMALVRPDGADVTTELTGLFRTLTSRGGKASEAPCSGPLPKRLTDGRAVQWRDRTRPVP